MPTICKDCKHCNLTLTKIHMDPRCDAFERTSYVTGDSYHPLCREVNQGDCTQFQPKVPFHAFRDHLGREFGVLDSLLLLKPLAENGTIVKLRETSHDPATGQIEIQVETIITGQTLWLKGTANKPIQHAYRLGTEEEILELLI